MLDPCNPCFSHGQCEHCLFGYTSDKDKHEKLKNLIAGYLNGDLGYRVTVERYMQFHENWKEEIALEEKEMPNSILKRLTDNDTDRQFIYELVDKIMPRKDCYIAVYFGEHGTSVNIYPVEEDEE